MELQVTLFSGNTPSPVTLQKDRKTERINKPKRQKQKSVKFKFSLKARQRTKKKKKTRNKKTTTDNRGKKMTKRPTRES